MLLRTVLFYVITFFLTVLLGGTQEATGIGAGFIILPQLAPGLAALLMLVLFRKERVSLSLGLKNNQVTRFLPALIIPAAAAVVILVILHLTGAQRLGAISFPLTLLTFAGMLTGAFGEELGWRAYLHKSLDRKVKPLTSSLVVGVLWALWHVGLYQNGLVYMIFAVVLITSYAFVLYALVADRDFNIWVATLFHLAINLTNLLYLQVMNETRFMIVNALVWAAGAAVIWWRRGLMTPHENEITPHE